MSASILPFRAPTVAPGTALHLDPCVTLEIFGEFMKLAIGEPMPIPATSYEQHVRAAALAILRVHSLKSGDRGRLEH